jgi:hypothetical protein
MEALKFEFFIQQILTILLLNKLFEMNSADFIIKVTDGIDTYVIPQKDDSFIKILGSDIDFEKSVQSVILAMTNIDAAYITKFDLPSLLTLIIKIRKHFPNFTIDTKIYNCINRYIDELFNQSFWLRLSNSVDCSFDKMDRRKFPYFNCVDEEWKSINTRAIKNANPYPAEMNGEALTDKAVTSTVEERRANWKNIEQKAINLMRNMENKDQNNLLIPIPGPFVTDGKTYIQKSNEYNKLFNSGNRDFLITKDGPVLPNAEEKKETDEIISHLSKMQDEKIKKQVREAVTYRPKKDPDAERNAESNDSNFIAFDLLEPQFYPDIEEYHTFIGLLYNAGLSASVIKLLYILPLTYECCHIIKTEWFWKFWNDLIYDEQLKNFVLYYSMYILKHEEIKSYSCVPLNARFIFDIEEARRLWDNIPHIGIDKHPLIHLMEPLGYKSSYMPFFLEGERKINSLEVFKRRLSIATNGLLDNIDLSKWRACLSGSILVPCIATNPLEERFKNYGDYKYSFVVDDLFDSIINGSYVDSSMIQIKRENESFRKYLECYYPSYESVPDDELIKFMEPEQTPEQYEAQKFEDLNSPNRDYPNEIDHAIAYNVLSDLDISIHTDTFEEFKVNVYELFEALRKRALEIADKRDGRIYIRRIRRVNNYKYSIYGPGINRPIDLFWITKSPDTFVEQFHLGVVRSHWDGKSVRIMQSAVAALLTGINHDYRWMSSNKAPAIPVLKYAQRGYTTPLNRFERPILIEYMTAKPEWTNCVKNAEQIYNSVSIHHSFFMPDMTKSGIRYQLKSLDHNPTNLNKFNNNRIKWNPITCSTYGIPLEYYNSSRNSVGTPTLDIIDKFIVRYREVTQ